MKLTVSGLQPDVTFELKSAVGNETTVIYAGIVSVSDLPETELCAMSVTVYDPGLRYTV